MSDGWNGSGVFSVSVDMSANAAAGINIVASAFSNQMDVVKAGINNTLTKDGQNVPTANLPMGGYQHTGTGKASAVDSYSRVNEFIHLSPLYMLDNESGASTTISCTATPWPASLSAGMHIYVRNAARPKPSASAATVCFRVNGLSANVVSYAGETLWPGAFASSGLHELIYDGTNFRLMNPSYIRIETSYLLQARQPGLGVQTVSVTTTASVEYWRDGNTAVVKFLQAGGIAQMNLAGSAANAVYLSALPSWMRPVDRRGNAHVVVPSTDTLRVAGVKVSTNGIVAATLISPNLYDISAQIPGFQLTYPIR